MVTLKQYYKMLVSHDWFYMYSDDISVHERGSKNEKLLRDIASQGGSTYIDLYTAFDDHYFSGAPFGTARIDKPKMPETE